MKNREATSGRSGSSCNKEKVELVRERENSLHRFQAQGYMLEYGLHVADTDPCALSVLARPELSLRAEPDPSTDTAIRLVSNGPSGLPKLEELAKLLQKPLPVRVPLAAAALRLLNRYAHHFDLDDAGSSLSMYVSAAVHRRAWVGGEPLTAANVDSVLTLTLFALDEALPEDLRLALDVQRDGADSTAQMASESDSGQSLRSDFMLREASTGRLLFKGEEKGADHFLTDAVADLKRKTARWSEYYCMLTD